MGSLPYRAALLSGVALAVVLTGCSHDPAGARIRYDLAIQANQEGRVQDAVRDLKLAVSKDPEFAEAHNALGLLYHVSLSRPDLAEQSYQEALRIRPDFSEAANNLGALYLSGARYAEAEQMFRQALDDVLYPTPHLARGNLGWSLYKQGRVQEAITELKAAVLTQPKFCQGFRNLGIIYRDAGRDADAEAAFARFQTACPEVPDAHYELGITRLQSGNTAGARAAFEKCVELAGDRPVGHDCMRSLAALDSADVDGLGPGGGGGQ